MKRPDFRIVIGLAAVALLLFLTGGANVLAQVDLIAELVRKAKAGEQDNGYCNKVPWTAIDRETYVRWLEGATVGTSKVNKWANGNCQYDEVTEISSTNGSKCVHYTYYACGPNSTCGTEPTVECKQPNGDWAR